ncbi:MAG TPA: tetratricopeptide repeat protein [Acidimicrobiales bacterium]|nr:tetratricopeptide repeat protein [Acidimicrobiales bacterium]
MATDVTDASFETDVLERSTSATVVVDLWAEWCGPCKVLGPILEKVVDETSGVDLVKIDVDANPRSASTFQVQSIPAVYAIRDRKVVDSFIGALPEPAVRQWIAGLNPPPSEVDRLIAAGDEQSLRKALELEPANENAVLGLASLLIAGGSAGEAERDEALSLMARLPETPETRRLAAQARLGSEAPGASPDGEVIEAKLDALLERVRNDDEARQEFVDLLEVLGPEDPRTASYRKALTARLF